MIIVFGGNGQLGTALKEEKDNREVVFFDRQECDITNRKDVGHLIDIMDPDVIINSAAYTVVDSAEMCHKICLEINAIGNKNIVEQAGKAKCVYISTNYVFDGDNKDGYTEYRHPRPLNYYGFSKLSGEAYMDPANDLIIRTSGLFGNGNNFVQKIIERANKFNKVEVQSDSYTNITYANDLAKAIYKLIDDNRGGTRHVVNYGEFSWYEFAEEILNIIGSQSKIVPFTEDSDIFKFYNDFYKAKRPKYGLLKTNYHDFEMPNYKNALKRYLKVI